MHLKVARRAAPDYTNREYWNGLIKMSLSKFFILCVLKERGMYGYELARAVEQTTQGCCSPTEGTLYPVLHEFEAGGYVVSRSEIVNGRERKIYELTPKGHEAFRVASQAWLDVSGCLAGSCATGSRCC
jgi:PadR family transcriptional regulator, regulatory protein PadR